MDIIFLLIPLVLVALVIWGFVWAVRCGQFEDLEGPGHSILMDKDEEMDASYKVCQNKRRHSRLAGLRSLARVSVSMAEKSTRVSRDVVAEASAVLYI
jgi:cbb3-type cytochrome oxidase maturation protein